MDAEAVGSSALSALSLSVRSRDSESRREPESAAESESQRGSADFQRQTSVHPVDSDQVLDLYRYSYCVVLMLAAFRWPSYMKSFRRPWQSSHVPCSPAR